MTGKAKCQAMVPGYCVFEANAQHHRKRRSQLGSNRPENLLWVCTPCHQWIHDNPYKAQERGLLLKSYEDETLPVLPPITKVSHCSKCKGTGLEPPKEEKELDKTPRQKVTFSFHVPKDERENGYELVETLLYECAKVLGRAEHKSYKYYTIIEVMHDFLSSNKGEVDAKDP